MNFVRADGLIACVGKLSGAVAACDGTPRQIQIPVVSINAARPLALMVIWQSPRLPRA